MMMHNLRFSTLRAANLARLPQFRNANGDRSHPKPDGSDWSLNDWMTAVCGEVGELANLLKKVRREDFTLNEKKQEIADEIADVAIYLDILAMRCGVDLGQAIAEKFNATSRKVGATTRILTEARIVMPAAESVIEEIASERRRQVSEEGRSHDSDDLNVSGQLAGAAACYIMNGLKISRLDLADRVLKMVADLWPWASHWWKPKDRRRDLIRAGALVVAEIERLDRLEALRARMFAA